jgi:hypothetical protein
MIDYILLAVVLVIAYLVFNNDDDNWPDGAPAA